MVSPEKLRQAWVKATPPPAPSPPAQSPSQSPRPVPPLVEDLGKAVQESQQKDMQTKDLAETNKKLKEEVQTLGAEVKGLRAKERHAEEQREEMQSLQFELMEQLMSLQFKGADDAVAQCLRTGGAVGSVVPYVGKLAVFLQAMQSLIQK